MNASLTAASQRDKAHHLALALSEVLINELDAADVVLLSLPLHNFAVPSVLKSWIDHVVRPDRTFRSTGIGKVGLLRDRPVCVLLACETFRYSRLKTVTVHLKFRWNLVYVSKNG
ncbi:NAD(P)H-dependent oxidoreductase [Xenorhabdus thuongxuanensis]|uniref:NAD(P)H-dependent oxidoreductase n=1 Tax=Xenorhabdus thuongxuanensis TaxID=1873484 RepID=UPI001FC9AEA6